MTGMTRHRAVLLICGLGGCAGMPQALPEAGTRFDGSYAGQNVLISGGGYLCGDPGHAETIAVIDGRFDYPFAVNPPRTTAVPVRIAVDGSLVGQLQYVTQDYLPLPRERNAWVTITGRIAGDMLDATISDARCRRRVTARKG
jgi:hypothetical protein